MAYFNTMLPAPSYDLPTPGHLMRAHLERLQAEFAFTGERWLIPGPGDAWVHSATARWRLRAAVYAILDQDSPYMPCAAIVDDCEDYLRSHLVRD